MLNNVSFMGKLPINSLETKTVEKIAKEAGYVSPSKLISNETTKVKDELFDISKEAAEAIKVTRSPINIKKPEEISDEILNSYKASIGK